MFASKEACVREVIERVLGSCLNDKDAVDAAFKLLKAYSENPRAFDDFRDMEEPLNLSSAFQWNETGGEGSEYWEKVNEAVVGVYHEISDGSHLNDETGEGCDDEVFFDSMGTVVKGWGLFNRNAEETEPAFYKTRRDARARKGDGDKVVRVALFAIAGD